MAIWQFHHFLRERMFKATPNPAHIALARFTLPELRHRLTPDFSFTLITQNIDGLDRRAIEHANTEAGRPNPFSATTAGPQHRNDPHRELDLNSPICPALAGTELLVSGASDEPQAAPAPKSSKRTPAEARSWAEARLAGVKQEKAGSDIDPDIPVEELPRCAKCGALARPDVVWFTEVPQQIDEVMRIVDSADVCVVVGTSAVVHPAATFSAKVKEHGGTVAVFNIEPGKRDALADFVFLGPCEVILPRVSDTPQAV
ncbi:DHS-like NAD/FAD-binding domain-containing protein [Trametes versicolor FP-101664 SS1]|uniref:DHS-like NAD/FAD-binding domain-containing protein n=1 Tax=Trametes versicolor (strain FP-101664) TaxID=717944 RepID=UPI00046227FC|nr:DHS-like NAD/FAD-binding domain-containing protein [Trametes versicolor FP-101664 SS1]EIW55317.1 DHS-like NAD/FAD-binding domain-containing protein [Trametes versicolor FP-101664 SS1]